MESIDSKGTLSLELVSSLDKGIRYFVSACEADITIVQHHLASYLPKINFRIVDSDYLRDFELDSCEVFELRQSRHYAHPLQSQDDYSRHDPASYIAGALTKLSVGDLVVLQLVVVPFDTVQSRDLHNSLLRQDGKHERKIMHFLIDRWWVWSVAAAYSYISNSIEAGFSLILLCLLGSFFIPRSKVKRSSLESLRVNRLIEKLEQPLFRVNLRIAVASKQYKRRRFFVRTLYAAFASFNVSGYQRLLIKSQNGFRLLKKFSLFKLQLRLPSFLAANANVFSASELADIYHFPNDTSLTEDFIASRSPTLPAPLAMKSRKLDVMLGRNVHHGTSTDIGLVLTERERHAYIIGGTGSGKTTMLQYALVQDIKNGKGVALIDPHGDLAEKLLKYIPKKRLKDVIYVNPVDIAYPIGLNLLELPDVSGDELLLAQDFIAEAIVSIFRKVFSDDDTGGHRIEHVLRNAIHTAFTVEGATLFTIRKVLSNPVFRRQVISRLQEGDLKEFWIHEFGLAGDYQKFKMMDGVIAKIGRFQRSQITQRMLGQQKSTIDFNDVLDGKILICNLAKGLLGEDTSQILGTTILTKLQLAAYQRITIDANKRKPFYVYIDEAQNFMSPLFVQILSESRKYRLFLTLAEQSTSQQDAKIVESILNNVGTVVSFRTGNPNDERLLLHQLDNVKKGEIMSLPPFNFYMHITGLSFQGSLSGNTIVLNDNGNKTTALQVVRASRRNYARRYKSPDVDSMR